MFLSNFQCVLNHSGMTHKVLGHSLVRSLVHSHRTLIHFLRTARFARALRGAHSLDRLLTHVRELNASIPYPFKSQCGRPLESRGDSSNLESKSMNYFYFILCGRC